MKKAKKLRFRIKRKPKAQGLGTAPGSLHTPEEAHETEIFAIAFSEDHIDEWKIDSVKNLSFPSQKYEVLWLDVVGLRNVDLLKSLAEKFSIHPLAMEDVTHLGQRPKVDEYGEQLFIVNQLIKRGNQGAADTSSESILDTEQVSMMVQPGVIITFQEKPGDCFEHVRNRIRKNLGRVRKCKSDYLAYALLDSIVDQYFPEFEKYEENLDELETQIMDHQIDDIPKRLLPLRHEILVFLRLARSTSVMLDKLIQKRNVMIQPDTFPYLHDLNDHMIRLLDMMESFRDRSTSLMDAHFAFAGQKLNEIMKVLTMISTIFIPLSFIAGLYGMNFNTDKPGNMPELNFPYAYVWVLGAMLFISFCLIYYFRKKKWL